MRVFIGLTEVSGYYSGLRKGFVQLGVSAEHVSVHAHRFHYGTHNGERAIVKFARYCVERRLAARRNQTLKRAFWLIMVALSRVCLFLWALVKFDVFILGGGSSFFQCREFAVLHFFGKKIIYVVHGTDIRPAYIDGIREEGSITEQRSDGVTQETSTGNEICRATLEDYVRVSQRRKRMAALIEKYAMAIIAPPSVGHFLTKPFVQWQFIGLPLDIKSEPLGTTAPDEQRATRVLHCPSHFAAKGTEQVRKAVERVRQKGHRLEYIEISNRPNHEVLAAIEECDFVVDQVYSDVPMAAFAAEAAFCGKPAVVGGYYALLVGDDSPEESIPPGIFCLPHDLEQAIETLVVNREFRTQLGERAREFALKNWGPRRVAERYLRLIEGNIPPEWLYEPQRIQYVYGMGLPEATAKAIIRGIIEQYGKEALLLSDKTDLEKRFVEFAFAESQHVATTV